MCNLVHNQYHSFKCKKPMLFYPVEKRKNNHLTIFSFPSFYLSAWHVKSSCPKIATWPYDLVKPISGGVVSDSAGQEGPRYVTVGPWGSEMKSQQGAEGLLWTLSKFKWKSKKGANENTSSHRLPWKSPQKESSSQGGPRIPVSTCSTPTHGMCSGLGLRQVLQMVKRALSCLCFPTCF